MMARARRRDLRSTGTRICHCAEIYIRASCEVRHGLRPLSQRNEVSSASGRFASKPDRGKTGTKKSDQRSLDGKKAAQTRRRAGMPGERKRAGAGKKG